MPKYPGILFAICACTIALVLFLTQRSQMIDGIPAPVSMLGGLFGAITTYLAFAEARKKGAIYDDNPHNHSFVRTLILASIFAFAAGIFLARWLFIQVAFTGFNSSPETELAFVEDRIMRCSRNEKEPFCDHELKVALAGSQGRFYVPVARQVYEAVGPNPIPQEHCLTVAIQEGRWGYKRAYIPGPLDAPLGTKRYVPCRMGALLP